MPTAHDRIASRLTIPGMTAVHATRAVFTALGGVPGVAAADVSRGVATVEHDPSVTGEMLRAAVEAAGFEVTAIDTFRPGLPVI